MPWSLTRADKGLACNIANRRLVLEIRAIRSFNPQSFASGDTR